MTAPAPARGTPLPRGKAILAVDFIAAVPQKPPAPELSALQHDVLRLMAGGLSNHEIAVRLELTQRVVEVAAYDIYAALGAINRTHAVTCAFQAGLLR
jgi:DNA-binding NarL/FixJ family response regulator